MTPWQQKTFFINFLYTSTYRHHCRHTYNYTTFTQQYDHEYSSFSIKTDKNELEAAQHFLEQAASNNHPDFLKALSDVLSHAGNSPVSRMAAGLQLKNQLTSKDENVKLKFQAKWLQLPEDIRTYVKKNVSLIN